MDRLKPVLRTRARLARVPAARLEYRLQPVARSRRTETRRGFSLWARWPSNRGSRLSVRFSIPARRCRPRREVTMLLRRAGERGSMMVWALMALIVISGILVAGMESLRATSADAESRFRAQGQALDV